jgi:integrase
LAGNQRNLILNERTLSSTHEDQVWLSREFRHVSAETEALEAIMAGTGMEWQAAVRLRRRDIDVTARTIHAHGGKNPWRDRICVVTEDWTWPIVESYARPFLPNARLFDGLKHRAALDSHHKACAIAHVAQTRLHDWRHTYAVTAIRRGMPLHLVAANLGHRDSTLVQKVYGKYAPQVSEYSKWVNTGDPATESQEAFGR